MINVAIIGVGSFTKALLEGVSFYKRHPDVTIGLAHPYIGPYHVNDLNFVAAFDIDEEKVGQKLHQAISYGRNVSFPMGESLPFPAIVHKGPSLDSVIPELGIHESLDASSDVSRILKETETQVVINLLPSGSNLATEYYANQALIASCHFVNAIPTPLATLSEWKKRFQAKKLVLLGDDIKSQFGATMLNRLIVQALKQRGINIHHSHQHNRGGNMDHLNLVYRQKEKEHSKKKTIEQFLSAKDGEVSVSFEYTGNPSSHKQVEIKITASLFGQTPLVIQANIDDEISHNGAGIAVDALRVAKLIADQQNFSSIDLVGAYLFKNPAKHLSDDKAYHAFERFLNQNN